MYKIPANTLFIGQNIVFVPECHSTNSLGYELSQKNAIGEGTVVITRFQTAGRGQRGNTWEVEDGKNLTFSVLLKPTFLAVKDQFYLTMVVSLALADMLTEELARDVMIKWPNDIMAEGKKICGILIENSLSGNSIQQTIAGIGLNVNQQSFILTTPTSMALASGKSFDLNTTLNRLLEKLEKRYLQLRAGDYDQLKEDYLTLLYWRNEEHSFQSSQEEFTGMVSGIDNSGRLLVNVRGQQKTFDLKEIKFLH